MLLARAGGRRTERQPGNSRWAAKAFALSHCPEPEAECDTSFSLPFCYSLLGSTVTAGAAKLTTFLHLFTPTRCLAACATHYSSSVHYPLHYFLSDEFLSKTKPAWENFRNSWGVPLTENSVFRAFLSLVSCSCWRTRNLILGFDKSWNGDPVQEWCACMAALWSILLLVLCWTCYKSTSRSVWHHWLVSFLYLICVWFSTWVPLTFVLVHPFPLGTHWGYHR